MTQKKKITEIRWIATNKLDASLNRGGFLSEAAAYRYAADNTINKNEECIPGRIYHKKCKDCADAVFFNKTAIFRTCPQSENWSIFEYNEEFEY